MAGHKIGLPTAIALVVGNMIGTGIFSSLGFQVGAIPSVTVLLFLWICGGLAALCGGLSYMELARLYPGPGGEYYYIRKAYPRLIAGFAGLVSVFAGFSAPVALSALAFSSYFSTIFPMWNVKVPALIVITCITLFHSFSIKLGGHFQFLSTIIKITVLIVFILSGLCTNHMANPLLWTRTDLSLITSGGFAECLVYVSFAYSGWNACVYIFNEIRFPEKNIGRSILAGTLIVTLLYLFLNFVFLKNVPMTALKDVVETGAVAAKAIFGTRGGHIMAVFISLILVSSISAMVWIGPRVIDRMLVKGDRQVTGSESKVPLLAMLLQYLITIGLLLTETFRHILVYTGILLCISACLAVSTLFLAHKKVEKRKLIAPAIFILINLYTLIVLCRQY